MIQHGFRTSKKGGIDDRDMAAMKQAIFNI
jgi:hypothetical protein